MFYRLFFERTQLILTDKTEVINDLTRNNSNNSLYYNPSELIISQILNTIDPTEERAVVLAANKLEDLKAALWKRFEIIKAGGGLVFNEDGKVLMMFRRGKWDLPKGKLDEGESIEECAVREIEEETGLKELVREKFITTTYHHYSFKGKEILKESYWYEVRTNFKGSLVPQLEEDITEVKWVAITELDNYLENTYASIREVFAAAGLIH
ncbi:MULTISPECIES: NUDIX hydrolase [unclassified Paraflavitalea]|uniref:NUDIX hydrolase n=1 Tax=unclassified Paraflavitalea TaxID=2798305 RepID=UPI003D32B3AB